MTIRHLYPAVEPSLNLDFANSKRLDSRITFTRGSTGTYIDESGIIRTAAANEARFDHDSDGNSLGLLVEESRTNLLTYSEDLSQWTAIDNATLSSAPSSPGTTNASRVTSTTSATWARAWSPIYSGSGGNTVGSVYLRTDTPFTASLRIRYDSGELVVQNVSVTTEWQRFSVNAAGSFTNSLDFMIFLNADGVYGTSVNGRTLDVWGAQLEASPYPTSYIPTAGATATRAADLASITGSNFSSWYRQDEGTVFTAFNTPAKSSSAALLALSIRNATPTEFIEIYTGNSSSDGITLNVPSGRQFAFYTRSAVDNGKYALALQQNNFAVSKNGNTALTDTNGLMTSSVDRMFIGGLGSVRLNGHISRLTYYPVRLPDATLQALTL